MDTFSLSRPPDPWRELDERLRPLARILERPRGWRGASDCLWCRAPKLRVFLERGRPAWKCDACERGGDDEDARRELEALRAPAPSLTILDRLPPAVRGIANHEVLEAVRDGAAAVAEVREYLGQKIAHRGPGSREFRPELLEAMRLNPLEAAALLAHAKHWLAMTPEDRERARRARYWRGVNRRSRRGSESRGSDGDVVPGHEVRP